MNWNSCSQNLKNKIRTDSTRLSVSGGDFMNLVSYSHSSGQLTYHVVLVTKYRTEVFISDRRRYVCENVLKWVCRTYGIEIIKIKVLEEHIHIFVRIGPTMSVSEFFNLIKGCSARRILVIYPEMRKELRGNHLWTRGKFVRTVGSVTDEAVSYYIEHSQGEDFERYHTL